MMDDPQQQDDSWEASVEAHLTALRRDLDQLMAVMSEHHADLKRLGDMALKLGGRVNELYRERKQRQ
jgi:hypothetical protein